MGNAGAGAPRHGSASQGKGDWGDSRTMSQETQNYGLAGGRVIVDVSGRELAISLTRESSSEDGLVRWSPIHAHLYVEMGLDQAEHHANWGV